LKHDHGQDSVVVMGIFSGSFPGSNLNTLTLWWQQNSRS